MKKYIRSATVGILDEGVEGQQALAIDPNTRPAILTKLATSKFDQVRTAVARNPNTPPEVLNTMGIGDFSSTVKMYVAKNPNTPKETLEIMLDRWLRVRDYYRCADIARNPNTPIKSLDKISKIYDDPLLEALCWNPNLTAPILTRLSKATGIYVRALVARHANTPESLLVELLHDDEFAVIEQAVKNPNIPADALEEFISSAGDPYLIHKADENLMNRGLR